MQTKRQPLAGRDGQAAFGPFSIGAADAFLDATNWGDAASAPGMGLGPWGCVCGNDRVQGADIRSQWGKERLVTSLQPS